MIFLVQSTTISQAATGEFVYHETKGGTAKSLYNPEDGPCYTVKIAAETLTENLTNRDALLYVEPDCQGHPYSRLTPKQKHTFDQAFVGVRFER
ncbi:hypothetical protein [Streptomyces sp. NPDC014734]|uniref:hypothetical protein n=1 Tax=Streptomyces sp. NPDC014734 TaxID=3364886 RepID=UPI0036FA806E